MIDWNDERGAAVQAIKSTASPFKVLLKTKDDAYFLDKWIRHHASIVGLENLIIFDNDSQDPAVDAVFAKFANSLLTIRYHGFHNDLHDCEKSADLYGALKDSCRYFQFLDSDEFLILVRGHRWYADDVILRYLQHHDGAHVIPSPWLYCTPRFQDLFKFGKNEYDLINDIRWGKPVIRSDLKMSGLINHNIQIAKRHYSDRIPTGLFVLHLAHLSPRKRIASNMRKLIARTFLSPGESVDGALKKDLANVQDNNIRLYISEIVRLRNMPEPSDEDVSSLGPSHIRIRPDSVVEYFSDVELLLMCRYLVADSPLVSQALWN